MIIPDMMSSVAFFTYMYLGNTLDLAFAIEIMALFNQLRGPIGRIANIREEGSNIIINTRRIQHFLSIPEVDLDKLL